MKHPPTEEIDRTLSRIAAANAEGYGILLRRRDRPGDGWFQASELAGDVALPALLSRVRGMSGPPEDHIRAEWMLESLARAIADLAGSFLVSSRRLPDLSPENVLLAAEGGLIRATGVLGPRMSVLPGDPAEGLEGVTVAEDWKQLADWFRAGFTGLMDPAVEWTDSNSLRPAKTLWQASADRLAQSLIWSAEAFEDPAFARDLTKHVIEGDERLRIPLETAEDDYDREYHLRATCCLAYRTPEGSLCQACPLNR